MLIKNFFFCLILLFLWSCNSDVQPKPEAYLRLKYEKPNYKAAKKHPNFSFEYNTLAELRIYDQGKGIAFNDRDKIFSRFYTDRDQFRGDHSGLGLSISREIIKSFNGSIELTKSDNFDFSGACFMIKLPLRIIK